MTCRRLHNIGMTKPRPPYLLKETARGKTFWYVRKRPAPRVRLRGAYGSPEFMAAYHAAISGVAATAPRKPGKDTFKWLWELYHASPAWRKLGMATHKQRENIIRPVLAKVGDKPVAMITRKFIVASRDSRADTPSMARHYVETMRGLFKWALDAEHVDADPTRDVAAPKLKTDGFHTWTAPEMAAFEKRWPIGTRQRLAYDIMLYTGFRRGDAARVGPLHVVDGVISLRTSKTGEAVTVRILPPLALSIASTKCGAQSFIIHERTGKPMSKEGFGNWFGDACREAKVPGSAHGLRKALAVKVSEAGATNAEMDALFAWQGGGMAELYSRKASRTRLAESALARLGYALTPPILALTDEITQ